MHLIPSSKGLRFESCFLRLLSYPLESSPAQAMIYPIPLWSRALDRSTLLTV
ncbi:hypothetical protein Hanom_Chr00s000001g01593811 [Helianthus anomalus]